MPPPSPDQARRVQALAALLMASTHGSPVGGAQLKDVLSGLTRFPPSAAATTALAEAVSRAAAGLRLDDQASTTLATILRQAMNGGYLDRQALDVEAARLDRMLRDAGASADVRRPVVDACRRVAREEDDPRKDWW